MKDRPADAGDVITATGRVPGRKGMQTRQRLLEEVERRCLRAHYRSITVTEIAQAAETSAGTFYHYFPDVASAVAEVAATHLSEFDAVIALAHEVVVSEGDLGSCQALCEVFFNYWKDRPGLIEAIVIASRDEDPRVFRRLLQALVSLTDVLSRGVSSGHPTGVAGSLVMMLSHAAARRDGFERDGVPPADLVESQARIIHAVLSTR